MIKTCGIVAGDLMIDIHRFNIVTESTPLKRVFSLLV